MRFGWFFPFFKKNWFLSILGPPDCGFSATIRIGREMLCLPYAGFFNAVLTAFLHMFKFINKTSEENKKCSLDKTGEQNVVLDLTISV